MIFCKAIAFRRGGEQCRQLATVDVDGDGQPDACYLAKHQDQVRKLIQEAAQRAPAPPPPAPPLEEEPPPPAAPPAPLEVDPELELMLRGLPPADQDVAAEVARTVAESPLESPSLEELEQRGSRLLGEVPADVAAADREADERAEQDLPPLRREVGRVNLADKFSAQRIRFYLKLSFDRKFVRDGKDQLDDDELEEGAVAIAEALADLFGPVAIQNPYLRSLAWGATVIGMRYWEEIVDWAAVRFFGGRRRAAPLPPAADTNGETRPAVPAPGAARRDQSGVAADAWSKATLQ